MFRHGFLLVIFVATTCALFNDFRIGTGIYDITGPAAEAGMMGYAMAGQRTNGLHIRQRARAFVFDNNQAGAQNSRVVFVSTDTCMIFHEVKSGVIAKLQAKFGNLYTEANVMMSGTHTHAGPGGYAWYALYDVTTLGFHKPTYDVIVDGIYQAIVLAHNNLSNGGRILLNVGEVDNANINRSPTAYANNPGTEQSKYKFNTDHVMTLLRLQNEVGADIGMINWFSVHGTSMNNTNGLISGDNKGYAGMTFEKYMKKNGNSTTPFVGAFAQTNEGDVSPNTRGTFCPDGSPCEHVHSTCGGKNEGCHGYGPGKDDFESTQIIGTYQMKGALSLFNSAVEQLSSHVSYVHTFVEMPNVTVLPPFSPTGQPVHTCEPALGDSFAAGTTDGPGEFDFIQGSNSTKDNPFWNFIAGFLSRPTAEQKKCQFPKPILLNVGGINFPLPWVPTIIPIQLFRLGDLFIIGVPGEFSTMAGRRLRDSVMATLVSLNATNPSTTVVIAGLTNTYTHYITTYEEYVIQRYEGASTLYGPYTLAAYQQLFSQLATAMIKGTPVPPGPNPPDLSGKTFNFQPPVIVDGHPAGKPFGSIAVDVNTKTPYKAGDVVSVQFWGASPRNDFLTEKTFLTVERNVNNNWEVVYNDGDWETKYHWKREKLDYSLVTIEWAISADDVAGTYRIRTFGTSKNIVGKLTPYEGTSSTFTVSASTVSDEKK